MAHIMTKRGSQDNIITYEHICNTRADRDAIDPAYITLGTTAIVLKGENNTLEIFMADSDKEWVPLMS